MLLVRAPRRTASPLGRSTCSLFPDEVSCISSARIAMSIACPRTHLWLHQTLYKWLQPINSGYAPCAARYVSTTSAIKRGLRSEEQKGRERHRSTSQVGKLPQTKRQSQRPWEERGNVIKGDARSVRNQQYRADYAGAGDRDKNDSNASNQSFARGSTSNRQPNEGASTQFSSAFRSGKAGDQHHNPNKGQPWVGLVRKHQAGRVIRDLMSDGGSNHASHNSETPFEDVAETGQRHPMKQPPRTYVKKQIEPFKIKKFTSQGRDPSTVFKEGASDEEDFDSPAAEQENDEAIELSDPRTVSLRVYYLICNIQALESRSPAKDSSESTQLRGQRQELRTLLSHVTSKMQSGDWKTADVRRKLAKVLGSFKFDGPFGRPLWAVNQPRSTVKKDESVIVWSENLEKGKATVSLLVGGSGGNEASAEKIQYNKASADAEVHRGVESGEESTKDVKLNTGEQGSESLNQDAARVAILVQRIQRLEDDRRIQRLGDGREERNEELRQQQIKGRTEAISSLRRLLASMNQAPMPALRRALTLGCGSPQQLWVWSKKKPMAYGRTVVWFQKDIGMLALVLKEDGKRNVLTRETEANSDENKGGGRVIDDLHATIHRMRLIIAQLQGEENGNKVGKRGRMKRKALEDKLVEKISQILADVNKGVTTREYRKSTVRRALGLHADKNGVYWTNEQPDGKKSMLWWREEEGRLEVVRKGSLSAEDTKQSVDDRRKDVVSGLPAKKESGNNDQQSSSERRTNGNENGAKANQEESDKDVHIPLALPYTVAASSFLYGSNTVLAALSAKRRRLYHLYLHDRVFSREANAKTIEQLATDMKIPITRNANVALLDKMSDRRPHNGVVLEASMLSAPPVLGLGKPDQKLSVVPLELDRQSAEDIAVNGAPAALPSLTNTWRHPFILLLDGILDEGNMGNIIRTAHFYGVDAVAVGTNTCAPINSPVVAKASSGAIEAVQIFALPSPSKFVYNCVRARWRIYAAMAPPPGLSSSSGRMSGSTLLPSRDANRYVTANAVGANSPLAKKPCILMLGAEGEGLRDNLKNRADYFVSIPQGERGMSIPGVGVDSVNVGVAAGVLVESFLRKPEGAVIKEAETDLGF